MSAPFHIHRATRPGRAQSERKQLVSTEGLLGARHFIGIISINPGKQMANVDIFTIFQMMKLRLTRGHPSSRWQSWDLDPRKCHRPPRTHLQRSLSHPPSTGDSVKSLPSYLVWVRKLEFPAISSPADKRLAGFIGE